ncbi:hypothetical protein [Pandoraea sp. ISTKB]|uniref:hypothetical protein n=1 Tax=Pandoraea sp. ISTKB TaxID=1586708 RepID=UPI0008474851|nr:hypothetical protein [Pandoraea sp. ISTKB]ODP35104.1 hypothetical protein A9762_12130 [Pandoraea sp. ISTKB]
MTSVLDLRGLIEAQARANANANAYWLDAEYPFARYLGAAATSGVENNGWIWRRGAGKARMLKGLMGLFRPIASDCLCRARGDVAHAAGALEEALRDDEACFFDLRAYVFGEMGDAEKLQLMAAMGMSGRIYPALFGSVMRGLGLGWADVSAQLISPGGAIPAFVVCGIARESSREAIV